MRTCILLSIVIIFSSACATTTAQWPPDSADPAPESTTVEISGLPEFIGETNSAIRESADALGEELAGVRQTLERVHENDTLPIEIEVPVPEVFITSTPPPASLWTEDRVDEALRRIAAAEALLGNLVSTQTDSVIYVRSDGLSLSDIISILALLVLAGGLFFSGFQTLTARKQAATAEQSLKESIRPVLCIYIDFLATNPGSYPGAYLKNVGNGVAFIDTFEVYVRGEDGQWGDEPIDGPRGGWKEAKKYLALPFDNDDWAVYYPGNNGFIGRDEAITLLAYRGDRKDFSKEKEQIRKQFRRLRVHISYRSALKEEKAEKCTFDGEIEVAEEAAGGSQRK